MDHVLFIHPSFDGLFLGCSHLLATVNSATLNHSCTSFCLNTCFQSFWLIFSRSGIARSYGNCFFFFPHNFQMFNGFVQNCLHFRFFLPFWMEWGGLLQFHGWPWGITLRSRGTLSSSCLPLLRPPSPSPPCLQSPREPSNLPWAKRTGSEEA